MKYSDKGIIEGIADGVLVHDPETGKILDANSTYLEMHGYHRSEIIGHTVDVVSADDPQYSSETAMERITEAHRDGEIQFEWLNKRASGETFPVEVNLSPVALDGKDRVVATLRDISERKEQEKRRRTARRHLEAVLEAPEFGLFLKNTDLEYLLMNDRDKAKFGLDELSPGMTDFDIVPEETAKQFRKDDRTVLETEEPLRTEERIPTEGGVQTYLTTKVPVYDETDELYSVAGFSQDITEKKEYKRELEKLNTRLTLVLEETDTGIWEWDLDTGEVMWDETSKRLFGYDPETVLDSYEQFAGRVVEEDLEKIEEAHDHAIETGDDYRADFRVELPAGEQRWIQARGVVKYDETGNPERLLGIQTDITQQKERELQLEETKRTLKRSNERLDEFAGVISHDLRNPLTVILGRIRHIDVDGETQPHADAIERSAIRMEEMVDELLALSRAGQHIDEQEAVSLAEAAADSWKNIQTEGVELDLSVRDTASIKADRDRLLHVFENLFRNATDHNDPPLTLRVGLLDSSAKPDSGMSPVGFYIEDDGRGIPESKREAVFERGYTTEADGTGLGLSIVKEITDAHDWNVTVGESETGGARFEIRDVVPGSPTD